MSLLGALGLIGATAALSELGNANSRRAYPGLDEKKFDEECSRYGVMHKNTTTQIMKIAARCKVVTDKNGILPKDGYYDCLKYVERYCLDPDDVDLFISAWEQTINIQEKRRSEEIIEKNEEGYKRIKNQVLDHINTTGPEIVLEYEHWFDLRPEEYKERLMRLYTETYLGDIAIQKPILRNTGGTYRPYIETWVLRGKEIENEFISKNSLKAIYATCCKKLGFEK